MQLIINMNDKNLYEKVIWFLNNLKGNGLEIIEKEEKNDAKEIDFSAFKIESFKGVDGVAYQKEIRDEW